MAEQDRDLSRAMWNKSSYSNNGGACVEVATNLPGRVAVRDSKDRGGGYSRSVLMRGATLLAA
jgi:hypothetical protein